MKYLQRERFLLKEQFYFLKKKKRTQQDKKMYLISNTCQLEELANFVNSGDKRFNSACYRMTADVDFSEYDNWTPIGVSSENDFKGIFYGDNYVIKNIKIKNDYKNYQGLFGFTGKDSKISHLGILKLEIIARDYTGGIAGMAKNTVKDCFFKGDIEGEVCVGGICGQSIWKYQKLFCIWCYRGI